MAHHWHRKIASMQDARSYWVNQTFCNMTPAYRNVKGAVVPVEVRMPLEHFDEDGKKVTIPGAAFGAAMGRNHRDAALQRQFQNARVGEVTAHYWHCMLAARVRQQ